MSGKRLWDKGKSLNKEIHAFTVGNDPIIDKEILPWDILGSAAHAIMLNEQKLLETKDLTKLLSALKKALKKAKNKTFDIPFELEDCHTALESFLVEECGDAGKRIHLGRSRNDQVLVAMRLYLRDASLKIAKSLLEIASLCHSKAISTISIQMPGHTHFQQAMPASVGMWYLAIMESSLELAQEAFSLEKLLNRNPLGVGSGFSSPMPINRLRTTELLSFAETQRNPINTQNSRGKYELKLLRLYSDISGLIEKYSFDLIIYSMQELNFIELPDEFTTGSSIMPQKRNPDVLELLRGNASKMRAKQLEVEMLVAKLPSHYHRDFQLTKSPVIEARDLITSMLHIFGSVIKKLEFKEDVLKETKTPELYATYEAFRLVQEGMTFRDAYRATAESLENGKIDVDSLALDFDKIAGKLSKEAKQAEKTINKIHKEVDFGLLTLSKLESDLFSLNSNHGE